MLNLSNTSSLIQVVAGSPVNAITVQASWTDLSPNILPPTSPQGAIGGGKNTVITTLTPTTVVPSPSANTDRNVKFLLITNTSSSSCAVTVQHLDGTTTVPVFVPGFVLQAGWVLEYNTDGNGWVVYDTAGKIQVAVAGGGGGGGILEIWAGTQTATGPNVSLANSNNVSFGLSNSSVLTALALMNVSAGFSSSNISAITFANSNNIVFGFDGTNVTASAADLGAIAAGTQTATGGTVVFSNSNGVTFGMSNSSIVTASVVAGGLNLSAGTTSNSLTAVTFANANGVSFGLSTGASVATVTAQNGGIQSWSNGFPATALTGGQNTLFFEPVIVPYCITVTNLLWLASVSNHSSNVSGGLSVSAALYTLNVSTLSLASSGSTNLTWTSGAPLSSNTGINYQQMSLASWALTPGPYLFAWWVSTQGSASVSVYGVPQQPQISSGQVAAMSTLMLPGYSQATTNALPTSFGISNTASYIRTGATAAEMPYIVFQGT